MQKKSEVQSLENYLAQIAHELRALPSQARADELREIESHLRTMIEAHGDVAGVLAQFGKPHKVGRDLRRAWERKQPEAWWRVILAPVAALAVQLILWFLLDVVVRIGGYYSWDTKFQRIFSISASAIISNSFLLFISFIAALNIIAGFCIGAVSPKHGKWIILLYFISLLTYSTLEKTHTGDLVVGIISSDHWFEILIYAISTILYFCGVQLGTRQSRKRRARITSTN